MPRIIVFLLTIAALAIVTLQNLATEVPLVILGKTFAAAMPLGLLLLLTVGTGALLTLVFYGLIGKRRPPESKYRPMGRRMPYPEGPGSSSPLPATGSRDDASFSGSSASTGYSSSSAFVSEPETSGQPSGQPFVSPPQDRPVQDTPPSSPTTPSAPSSEPSSSSFVQNNFAEPPSTYSTPSDDAYTPGSYDSQFVNRPSDSMPSAGQSAGASVSAAASTFVQQPIAGLKSVFGKKKDRKGEPDASEKPIGDDWGQRRTKEQINSWDTSVGEPSRLEEGAKSLFNLGRNVGANAGRLAEDIASGWNSPAADPRSDGRNDVGADGGDGRYADARYDGLDQGWENFDDYGEAPPPQDSANKRTYGDSLYGDDDGLDGDYADGPYADDTGPDGVYDADYKVIVPPSKPLMDSDDRSDDYA